MPSDLLAFASDAWLYILIFRIIWVAPTLGPALIGLCCIILQKKIHQYSQNNAFHSLFHKQTCHKSICDTGSIDSDVWRAILWCISSTDLYFYLVHFESIFQLWVPVNQPRMCHFPRWWGNSEPSDSVWKLLSPQSLSGEQIHGCASWCDQFTGTRECVWLSPHRSRKVQQSHECRIPLFSGTSSSVWGWGRHSRTVLWRGRLDPSSAQLLPKGWTHLPRGSQALHVPWGLLSISSDPQQMGRVRVSFGSH